MDVTFLEAIKLFYNRWNDFDGRSTRAEYWYVVLYLCVASAVAALLGHWVAYLFGLVNIIPNIALSIRRMHDIGKSGWWILIGFVPLIGWIWYLVLLLTPSDPGSPYRNGSSL